jgi:hypothetical protein
MDIALKQRLLFFGSYLLIATLALPAQSSTINKIKDFLEIPDKLTKKTSWRGCPSQTAGKMVLNLVNEFDKNGSLYDLNKKIIEENFQKKYFVSKYNIKFNPMKNKLTFTLECPKALVRVSAINSKGVVVSSSILTETGDLYDPTYEILLKSEKILKSDLPNLAVPYEILNQSYKEKLTDFFLSLSGKTRGLISEIILDRKGKMTLILSNKRRPTSVFFGAGNWSEKRIKLSKMVDYLIDRKGLPKTINLTNTKKVVVKF